MAVVPCRMIAGAAARSSETIRSGISRTYELPNDELRTFRDTSEVLHWLGLDAPE